MVRGKTQMKRIENTTNRQVTFSKRRKGLLKKAFELSVLCDAEVALMIFSPTGKFYEFASSSMQQTIERYRNYNGDAQIASRFVQQNMQHLKQEIGSMMKKMELLEVSKRRLLGQDLGSCSLEELQEIEQHLENTVEKVRARKNHVFKEQLEQLTEKDKALREENARLSKYIQPKQATQNESENQTNLGNNPTSYVETDLFIGLPDTRTRRIPPPQV